MKLITIALISIALAIAPIPVKDDPPEYGPSIPEVKAVEVKTELKALSEVQIMDIASEAKIEETEVVLSQSGNCDSWIAAAGISDIANARELLRRESNCDPNAVNPSSGACGVAQELPCGKSGCQLGDGACQMKWMKSYVDRRYGSFAAAIEFHDRMNWY